MHKRSRISANVPETAGTVGIIHDSRKDGFDEAHSEAIRAAQSPMDATRMGRDRTKRLREDWESIKDEVMYRVVLAKFTQHPGIRSELLSTGDAQLVEHTKNDSYWGDGGDGSGKNMLGQILMRVRDEIRQSLSE